MKYAKIAGTGSYLPKKVLTNYDFEKMVDTSHEWILSRTGIEERHIAEQNETIVTMGAAAAQNALSAAKVEAQDIDLIIATTVTPQYFFPSTACMLQKELHCKPCMAFDLNAACSGFIYALDVARRYIENGAIQNALIVSTEVLSRIVDWEDRSTCVLFGDGAGAAVLQASDIPGILDAKLYAEGNKEILYADTGLCDIGQEQNRYLRMQGRELFKVIVGAVRTSLERLMVDNGMQPEDIDWIIPHQANSRIIDKSVKMLGFPKERVIMTLAKHANTSSASIPLALDDAVCKGIVQKGQTIILEAFGAGLTWGGILLRY